MDSLRSSSPATTTSERAAERLARRCARARVAAAVVVSQGSGLNDDMVALGPAALTTALAPLFAPSR